MAPSNDLWEIKNSKEEICGCGKSQEEMSAMIKKEEIALGGRRNERIDQMSVGKGLSLRPYHLG